MRLQALEEERLGPRRDPYSDERQKRLAVQEAATALICTLMPAIEPVTLVRPLKARLFIRMPSADQALAMHCPYSAMARDSQMEDQHGHHNGAVTKNFYTAVLTCLLHAAVALVSLCQSPWGVDVRPSHDMLQVTIAPREKYPLGQTVLKVNEQRERTHMFTRHYLEEQLHTVLAGTCSRALLLCSII